MLHDNNLAQLKQLRQQIEDQKEYADGVVKATQRRFGFVVTEDGREIYLAPDEMEKVFPGDKVKIQIFVEQPSGKNSGKKKNSAKPKTSGQLIKVLESTLTEFTGRYIVKGKGHFVEPDLPNLSRWIFIPPAKRKGANSSDFVRCKISKHPYPHAKPQAAIVDVIGPLDQPGVETDYAINKFQLDQAWPENWKESLEDLEISNREDLRNVAFITIDSASTVDMDDALFAKETTDGWCLSVAIADPCEFIKPNSKLEELIQARGTSVYLPGRAISMLPSELSNDSCSLLPNQARPSIVCNISISSTGCISDYNFCEAVICSHDKLSYHDVSNYLKNPCEQLASCNKNSTTLTTLYKLSNALLQFREKNNLVHNGRPNFRFLLNNKRKLDCIVEVNKSLAHSIVEECMVAANRCASEFLGEEGVFVTHAGFRKERIPDVKKLAEEQLEIKSTDPETLNGYQQLMRGIDDSIEFPIRSVFSRLLERSKLNTETSPHFGMGLSSYTTFTSPIRKFSDFFVHRIIKQKLRSEPLTIPAQEALDTLQQTLDKAHQARIQVEQQLKCQFMKPLIKQMFVGQVSQINSNGFYVRIDENNIEGFVDTRLLPEKYSFDPMRLRLSSKQLTIELEQQISIVVTDVDIDKRVINFTLAKNDDAASNEAKN